jgi:hypothetical protein
MAWFLRARILGRKSAGGDELVRVPVDTLGLHRSVRIPFIMTTAIRSPDVGPGARQYP